MVSRRSGSPWLTIIFFRGTSTITFDTSGSVPTAFSMVFAQPWHEMPRALNVVSIGFSLQRWVI